MSTVNSIDAKTCAAWSAPYRGWHYYPEHVIPAQPEIKGHEDVKITDVPTVYQLPGDPLNETFYMYYCAVGSKGRGVGLITSKPLVKKEGSL